MAALETFGNPPSKREIASAQALWFRNRSAIPIRCIHCQKLMMILAMVYATFVGLTCVLDYFFSRCQPNLFCLTVSHKANSDIKLSRLLRLEEFCCVISVGGPASSPDSGLNCMKRHHLILHRSSINKFATT